jgi:protein gp37
MGDLFSAEVPREWIEAVLGTIRKSPHWNFLLLTKNPDRLREFQFPANAWVGATVDRQNRVAPTERAFTEVQAAVKWISCEPMLERLTFSRLDLFQWLVIGGASRTSSFEAFRPPRRDVQHLWDQAEAVGVKVFEKDNLLELRREFPAMGKS